MLVKDQMGRELHLPKTLTRIVSLVPSQTELLVDLGLEDKIVGVTKFCVHPKHLRMSKKVVGGTKGISLEKIQSLNPDIILCNKEENTKEIVNELEKHFPVHVSDIETIDDAQTLILQYGKLFDCLMPASRISSKIKKEAESFSIYIKDKPTKRVAYFIWKNPWMSVGNDTFIHHLLEKNNYTNVFETQKRYPEISEKELRDVNPDLVLLSSEPFPFKENHIKEILAILPSVEVKLVDGEYFSWYGSRLQNAFEYFRGLHS